MDLSNFFSAAEGRLDRWRTLHRIAKTLVGAAERDTEALAAGGAEAPGRHGTDRGFLRLPRTEADGAAARAPADRRLDGFRPPGAADQQRAVDQQLPRQHRGVEGGGGGRESRSTDILPPSIGRGQSRKPYFEVLMVSPGERSMWPEIREVFRRLRRVEDPFVYEPVIVGSFEDAVLAMVFNYNLQAVVISDGFGFPSQYNVPALREILLKQVQIGDGRASSDAGPGHNAGADDPSVAARGRRLPDHGPRCRRPCRLR